MDYSSFIDLNSLSEEARKELEIFYDYLVFKYNRRKKKSVKGKRMKKFTSIQLDTKGFRFNREEANER